MSGHIPEISVSICSPSMKLRSHCDYVTFCIHHPRTMKNHLLPTLQPKATAKPSGFALVATLMLMLLLGILAIGMLSLSSISLRSSSQNSALSEARGNARMALMLAIGELQKNTGSDTRITAPADIVEPGAPPLTGVWKSWEGTDHDSTGRPVKPDYTVKTTAPLASNRFLSWLVSGAVAGSRPLDTNNKPSELVFTTKPTDNSTVPLLSDGTLGSNPGQVHVKPQIVNSNRGAIAWWVSGENQKARLLQPHKPRTNDAAGWSDIAKTYAVPDPEPFGLDALVSDPENYSPDPTNPKSASKALSLATSQFLLASNPALPQQSFHDLSTSASGLLTNTATGGWRKDLSILTEKWDSIYAPPGTNLPLFRLTPSSTTSVQKPTPTDPTLKGKNGKSIFYPWSDYRTPPAYTVSNPGADSYTNTHGAVASWQSLVNFATAYGKDVSYSSSTGSVPINWARTHKQQYGPPSPNFSNQDLFNYLHKTPYAPILARVQWVFNVRSRRASYIPTDAVNYNKFQIDLLVSPVYTLWNPYNVTLNLGDYFAVAMNKSFPMAIGFGKSAATLDYRRYINGSKFYSGNQGNYDSSLVGNYTGHWEQTNGQAAGFPLNISLDPGEVKSFSLVADAYATQSGIVGILKDGYDGLNAKGFISTSGTAPRKPSPILNNFTAADSLRIGMKFDNITQMGPLTNQQGPGIQMTFGKWAGPGGSQYIGDIYKKYSMLTSKGFSTAYWQAPPNFPNPLVTAILVEPSDASGSYDSFNSGGNPPWTPMFSVVFGPRISIGAGAGNPEDRPTKGVLVNNPFTTAALTTSDTQWTNHPVNIPFDFSVHAHQIGGSPTLPDDTTSKGYISTGFQESDGLSRLIMSEVPLRPMASLGELQHWNLQGNKPIPPYQYYIIGNSDASPLIQSDSILPASPVSSIVAENLQHDDAYCANHLLFDDWFFSSIAPQPTTFGTSISKNIETVYREYLRAVAPLTNRAYRPITADKEITDTLATTRIGEILNSSDGWLKVASRFEVEGMFNVNSTSTRAWRALLGHARKQQVAYYAVNGVDLDVTEHDHIVSRHTIASDVKAGVATGVGAKFTSGSEFAGFRTLNDSQLDSLAAKIVEQVRKRGPFLSLSEFVNRKLDSDQDVALAGAIQTALGNLADDPNAALKDSNLSSATMSPADPKLNGADYVLPAAAAGRSVFGFPGWIRQADVLRPIAPILSARDDTFTIRTYGDARDSVGNVTARAWCEATVRRGREFTNTFDAADSPNPPSNDTNKLFGRRFEVVSFRWLSQDEV